MRGNHAFDGCLPDSSGQQKEQAMMQGHASLLRILLIAIACGLVGYGLFGVIAGRTSGAKERNVASYQDSMHPWVKSDKPGKCTICGMDLTPIYEGAKGFGSGAGMVVLSSNSITVLDVQTDEVKRQTLLRTLRVAGILEANETRKTVVSAPVAARIQNLAVPYAGVEVAEGQSLVTLFSPELAQKRSYLRAVGVNQLTPGSDMNQVAKTADPFASQLVAPQAGVVIERNVYNGQYVLEGEKLLAIADASVLWFRFDVYEGQLPWFETGQAINVMVAAVPSRMFPATISFIDPTINDATRAVKVRADIANPVLSTNLPVRRLLRFGMYADGRVQAAIPNVLVVPRSAVLFPGGAAYAYVDKGGGAYERRHVKLGRQGDAAWEVLQGLEEGERVVTAGNVLIDAQAQFNQSSEPADAAQTAITAETVAHPVEPPADVSPDAPVRVETQTPPVVAMPVEDGTTHPPPVQHKPLTHYQADKVRMTVREEMWKTRMATIAQARGLVPTPADTNLLTSDQRQAVQTFIIEAAGVSQALAADDLKLFNVHAARMPGLLTSLHGCMVEPHSWAGAVHAISDLTPGEPAPDLAEARKRFLPFSTAVVALIKQIRTEDPAFAALKVYHCPMAPKPGLWFQGKAPLRNPFYGAAMLTCGEEVKP